MKFFKYLALLALASVPLLLIEKRKASTPVVVDSDDDIFERDLRAD
jgi:hypothetical protein